MKNKVKKAVFPVAGLGTRFLPATKATPKEMIPLIDKPLIQYAVEEAVAAGIDTIIFISGKNKRAIEDHFDVNLELEERLRVANNNAALQKIQNIVPKSVNCVYMRQSSPLGLGHAIACAAPLINNEPFAVLLADDLIINDSGQGGLAQLCEIYEQYQNSIIAVHEVPDSEISKYGVVEGTSISESIQKVTKFIEKPNPKETNSNLVISGRYILTPAIMDYLHNTKPGIGGEIQLTDALAAQLKDEPFIAYKYAGKHHDCGDKLGYLLATLDLSLEHPEYGDSIRRYLQDKVNS